MIRQKLSRRNFLMMTGGTGAALMLEPAQQFIHKLIPYVNPPIYPKPGEWAYYSTTCRECPAGCGLLMWHRDGRVTKAEGNPLHSINKGKICARGQASVQGEYNADRLTKVLRKDESGMLSQVSWETALNSIRKELEAGKQALVISDLQTGSLKEVMTNFTRQHGGTAPLMYEALNYESLRKANEEFYGNRLIPRYSLANCDLVISFGAPFLETWLSPVEYARDFAELHHFRDGFIGKSVYIAPAETLTATNADEFIVCKPGREAGIIHQVIRLISQGTGSEFNLSNLPDSDLTKEETAIAQKLGTLLSSALAPVILAGNPADASREGINTCKAAAMLNELLGNQRRINFSQYHAISNTALSEEVTAFFNKITKNHILFIHQTNPVYSIPGVEKMIGNAGMVVFIGNQHCETSSLAHWVLPANYSLEDWGDYEPWKGTVSLIQPTMQPIYETKSAGDIFLSFSGETTRSFKEIVRENWWIWNNHQTGEAIADDKFYGTYMRNGTLEFPQTPVTVTRKPQPETVYQTPHLAENRFFLYTYPSLFFYDGRLANRPWLQEIPDPVSNLVWQSWLDIHPAQTEKLALEEGDIVKVIAATGSIEVPVRITSGIDIQTLALKLGQGHWNYGKTASHVGVNAFRVSHISGNPVIPVVSLEKTGRNESLVYLNETKEQHNRELLKELSLTALLKGTVTQEEITWPGPKGYDKERDLYPPHEHKKHRWGMVIDLQACIGCKACETACYAENNIPVVGKKSCSEGKEMSWLKVPPYNISNRKTAFIPVPCQHCDAAPCEPVCPVFASVHNEEGLNAQIYNRCVGTRYCSNNCPYKVRRFNWSNIKHEYPATLQLNPEVTVRERGVMEKCTFCVQRIRNVEEKAKVEGRSVAEGEIVTACQQTCPTSAIVFGDLNDEHSAVSKLTNSERRYQLLRELNTKPAVVYLKKINITV